MKARRFIVTWIDPFDGLELCAWCFWYDIRRGAEGFFTMRIAKLTNAYRKLFARELMGRTPRAVLSFGAMAR